MDVEGKKERKRMNNNQTTEQEYIQTINDVIKQYEDGAITAFEVVNRLAYNMHTIVTSLVNSEWYEKEWKGEVKD